ncbi:UNVERIFIED_CONTAM: hypothetical protein Sangu_0967700 [Sesamum angustifolium]|uniref:Uncharacterized protein n=1 Tax=Sesamum angustifolium TaxID=2727405 RepID=A0AAW2PDE2_9LAMI
MILPFLPPETIYPHDQVWWQLERKADQGRAQAQPGRLVREYKATEEKLEKAKLEQEQQLEKGRCEVIWNYPHTQKWKPCG